MDGIGPPERRGGRARAALFLVACAAGLAVLVAAYSNHFHNGFHFDDKHVIEDNLWIRSLDHVERFFTDPRTYTSLPANASYRPLLTLSYALDHAAGDGLEPVAFHRTQFALHVVLWLVLLGLFRRVLDALAGARPAHRWLALLAATLFSVHTANTETVNYLSSRSSLVGTLGVAASLLCWLAWPRARAFGAYLVPMLVCGLAKPLTVVFAPILFVFLALERGADLARPFSRDTVGACGRALLRSTPALLAAAGLYLFLRAMEPDTLAYSDRGPLEYLRSQAFVWVHYVRLFLVPVGLTADTDWRFDVAWHDTRLFAGVLFALGLAAIVVVTSGRERLRPIAFGLAWFALALVPTASVIPLSEVYNEHRIFFPYVGLTLAAVWALWTLLGRLGRAGAIAAALVLVAAIGAHAVGTHVRNRVWRDGTSLWSDVVAKSPDNGRGLMNYGLEKMRRAEYAEALDLFERAKRAWPTYEYVDVNLAIVKHELGRTAEVEPHFRRALAISPRFAQGHYYYGEWLADSGRGPEAIEHLATSLELSGSASATRRLLTSLRFARGERDEALRIARETLSLEPRDETALALVAGNVPYAPIEGVADGFAVRGRSLIDERDFVGAAVVLRHALALDPGHAIAWNNLGWALHQLGFLPEAIDAYERALAADPTLENARNNLRAARERAAALAEPRDG